jgi:hypothetical protein
MPHQIAVLERWRYANHHGFVALAPDARNLPRAVARASFWREIAPFWREIADIMHPQLCEEFLHVSE